MLTKPCERTTNGCTKLVHAKGPKRLAARRFCSLQCSTAAREEISPLATRISREARRRGAHKTAVRRRAAAISRAVGDVRELLPASWLASFAGPDRAQVMVVLAQVWKRGYSVGYKRGFEHVGRDQRLKAKRVAA